MKTVAYLLSEYPTLGHTYILREVRQLREMGWSIQTLSIRKPPRPPSELSPAEREEWNSTWYILTSDPVEFLKANLVTFVTRPRRYLSGLRTAMGFGRCNLRSKARSIAYFAEAVLAGQRLQSAGIEHVHSVYTSTVALILSRIFDVRLSLTIHGPSEFFDAEGFHLREKVAASELVTGISSYCRSQIMLWAARDDWSKIEVVPLGIDIGNWRPVPFRERPAPFNLISVGRLNEVKGYPLLLQAVASLLAQGKDVRLRLVGDGPDAPRLRDLAQQLASARACPSKAGRTRWSCANFWRRATLAYSRVRRRRPGGADGSDGYGRSLHRTLYHRHSGTHPRWRRRIVGDSRPTSASWPPHSHR